MKDSESKIQNIVVAVDLDGTLCTSDTLIESLWWIVRHRPLKLLKLFPKLFHGKAKFKNEVFKQIDPQKIIKLLPWNKSVIKYLKEQKDQGKEIVLATASDTNLAHLVQKEFSFITKVFATNDKDEVNLKGQKKAHLLISEFGVEGFDYLANDISDIPVWKKSNEALLVSDFQNPLLKQKLEKINS